MPLRIDLENMLRQTQEFLELSPDTGPHVASLEQLRNHIRLVRNGGATLDEFADLYMLRQQPKK